MRRARIAPAALLAALLGGSCSSPPPVVEESPKRKSFEESADWQAPAAGTPAGYEAQARAIEQKWERVKQSEDEAERQRLANEALRETRALADQPPPR
jgi:hypothetical protein